MKQLSTNPATADVRDCRLAADTCPICRCYSSLDVEVPNERQDDCQEAACICHDEDLPVDLCESHDRLDDERTANTRRVPPYVCIRCEADPR